MKRNVAIVTAFFDIKRDNWKSYSRTEDKYFEYFSLLCKVDNPIFVVTQEKYVEKIKKIRNDANVLILDLFNDFKELLNKIENVLKNKDFISKVNPKLLKNQNPEYTHPEYNLVTYLKSFYVNHVIENCDVKEDMISWVDFGYVRSKETLKNRKSLIVDFDINKFHIFTLKKINKVNIKSAILNNEVYIAGGSLIGSKQNWIQFNKLIEKSINDLIELNILGNDESLYLKVFLENRSFFKEHLTDWFSLFEYSKSPYLVKLI